MISGYVIANFWLNGMINASIWGSVTIAGAWLVMRCASGLPPSIKSWVWRIVFIKLVLAAIWITPFEVSVLPSTAALRTVELKNEVGSAGGVNTVPESTKTANTTPQPQVEASRTSPFSPVTALFCLWLAGSLGSLILLVRRWRQALQVLKHAHVVEDETLISVVRRTASLYGISTPKVYASTRIKSPFVFGITNPVMIVPAPFVYQRSETDLIVAHELGHIKRKDLLWSMLPSLARTLFYFNPLLWIAEREWVKAQEIACDELAIDKTKSTAITLSKLLVSIVEKNLIEPTYQLTALSIAESKGSIKSRIQAMMQFRKFSQKTQRVLYAITVVTAAFVIVPWKLTAQKFDAAAKLMERMNIGFEQPLVDPAKGIKISYDGVQQDFEVFHTGKASGRMSRFSENEQRPRLWGCFSAEYFIGQRLRYSGFLKTDVTAGYAALHMWIGNERKRLELGQDHMIDRGVVGKTDWKKYDVIMDIPSDASMICVGAGLYAVGLGTVWVDDLSLDVIDEGGPEPTGYSLSATPRNTGFEDGENVGGAPKFWTTKVNSAYDYKIDTGVTHGGRNSLKISSADQQGTNARIMQCVLAKDFSRRDLEISAFVRAENFVGQIELAMRGDGMRLDVPKGAVNGSEKIDINGTFDWKKYSVSASIVDGVQRICFNFDVRGTGSIWFDDIQLTAGEQTLPALPEPTDHKQAKPTDLIPIQGATNLNFEEEPQHNVADFRNAAPGTGWATHHPDGWAWFERDQTLVKEGLYSARLERAENAGDTRPELYQCIDAAPYISRVVHLSGFLKTQLQRGYAGLQMRINTDGPNGPGTVSERTEPEVGPHGETPWTEFALTLAVPEDAKSICIGAAVFQQAVGSAWVDDMRLGVSR